MDLENERRAAPPNTADGEEARDDARTENASERTFSSELTAPYWSLVSFETRVAKNLTYAEAAEKLNCLAAEKVPGLCIITDEAAGRIEN